MEMKTSSSAAASILELTGRFDAFSAPPVVDWLAKMAAGTQAHAIVNLVGVNFIDSTACAALVQGLKRCRERGGDLRLCCLQQPVRIIFELTRLDRAFQIYDSEPTAVESFTA